MSDSATFFTLATAGTIAIGITAAAGLKGWQEWLDLRRADLIDGRSRRFGAPVELIELKARVRRLEAIASGSET